MIAHNDLGFLDRLGEGGSGIVYRGLWKSMNKVVAIKKVDNIDEREVHFIVRMMKLPSRLTLITKLCL